MVPNVKRTGGYLTEKVRREQHESRLAGEGSEMNTVRRLGGL